MQRLMECPQCKSKNTVGRLQMTHLNKARNYFCNKCLVEFTKEGEFVAPIKLEEKRPIRTAILQGR